MPYFVVWRGIVLPYYRSFITTHLLLVKRGWGFQCGDPRVDCNESESMEIISIILLQRVDHGGIVIIGVKGS